MKNQYLMAQVKFYRRAWREEFKAFLSSVRRQLTVVSPYIRQAEAVQVCETLAKRVEILTLTAVKPASILAGSLEMSALKTLVGYSSKNQLINVPSLHAKIYIADHNRAIITSANLTTSGIQFNYEYGVEIKDDRAVQLVSDDMKAYAEIGQIVTSADVEKIISLLGNYTIEKPRVGRASLKLERELSQYCDVLQVGEKSSTALFSGAISYVLQKHKVMTTRDLQVQIQSLYPELCSDDSDRIINGETYGKLWKHHFRNAQQQLKRQGEIGYADGRWEWLD